jgi:hypothetical protein
MRTVVATLTSRDQDAKFDDNAGLRVLSFEEVADE